IRLTGHDPQRRRNFLSLPIRDLDERHVVFAALGRAAIVPRVRNLLRGLRTDDRDVVPCDFRERLWKFLQPAVVCEPSVVDRWIRSEYQFKTTRDDSFLRSLDSTPTQPARPRGISRQTS